MTAQRVVSLIASATETLHALGSGDMQVGRSHECDWPAKVLDLPDLTRAKFKVRGATSAEIDQSVKGLIEQGLAVYEVDATRLKGLAPDVILTQDQCEVCAVSLADVERAVCSWTDSRAAIISLRPHTMQDIYNDIARVADAIDKPEQGSALTKRMQERLQQIADLVKGRPRPRLAYIEWTEPPMSGGHWMPELIEIAGGENLFGTTGENSPWIKWKEVANKDPDVILVGPCGYDLTTTLRDMEPLRTNSTWKNLRAVREGRVFAADGNAYFNRPGPRLVESAEILAEILHPDVCDFGHKDTAYVPWTA